MPGEKRILYFKFALPAGFLLGIFFAHKLWLSSRLYPLTPVLAAFARIPYPVDSILLAVLIGLLIAVAVSPSPRKYIAALLLLLLALDLGDQSRWWPSFYEYTLMFLVLAFHPWDGGEKSQRQLLNTFRLIVCGVYFWSGVQKINPYFAESFHSRFISRWQGNPAAGFLEALGIGIWLVPFVEIAFAVGLLTRRFRNLSLAAALVMHAAIFFGIGPLAGNWNNSAWAWNLATAAFVFILFFREREESFTSIFSNWGFAPRILVLIVVGFLPLLSFFGRWDAALSFDVYSGNARLGAIYVDRPLWSKLPSEIERHVRPSSFGRGMLLVWGWTAAEFNAGPYAELRIFKNVLRKICSYGDDKSGALLVVRERGTWINGWSRPLLKFSCGEV
jgi:hypothetical protein